MATLVVRAGPLCACFVALSCAAVGPPSVLARSERAPEPAAVVRQEADAASAVPAALALVMEPELETGGTDSALIGGWGTAGCIGLASDVRPPVCSEPTGCYQLSLMDLALEVGGARGGVSLEAAQAHYESALLSVVRDTVRACFAYELERGRPPTGTLTVRVQAEAGGCADSADAKVIERTVGDKTASCVRDALARQQLPPGEGPATLELVITLSGL